MSEKIIVPTLGESVTEATVAKWLKNKGDKVSSDEPLVELETDKVNVEVPLHQMECLKIYLQKKEKRLMLVLCLGQFLNQN